MELEKSLQICYIKVFTQAKDITFLTNNMLCSGCKARRKLAAGARKKCSVVSIFYTHKARFFNKSECALYLNFITEMQNKNVLITCTKLGVDTTFRDK